MSQTVGGNQTAFARLVRTSSANVHGWIRHKIRPELAALLHVCCACGITLSDLLQANPKTLQPVVTRTTARSQVQRRTRFPAAFRFIVQQELENVVASGQYSPISLTEVARRCGCHNQTLRQCDPAACDVISARYQAYMHLKKEQRLCAMGDTFKCIGRLFRSQGIAFSHRQVARHLAQRRLFSTKEVRDLFRQVRLELEMEEISIE
jgi:hypothetical protein